MHPPSAPTRDGGVTPTLSCMLQGDDKLLVATPAKFKKWFNVDVLENTEVTSIDTQVGQAGCPCRRSPGSLRNSQHCLRTRAPPAGSQ